MSYARKFKCYANLDTTESKVVSLLREFSFTTMGGAMKQILASASAISESEYTTRWSSAAVGRTSIQ
jgi:hypothetical protein